MPRINLLPWREQQRIERKKAFAVGMVGAVIAALGVAGIGWFLMNQMIDAQRDRNELLRTEIRELDKKIEEINNLEAQKQQHIARMEIIEKLQRSRPEIVHVFDTFTRIIPDGVYLTSVRQTGRNFQIQGVSQSPTRVSDFMRSIEGSGLLEKPWPSLTGQNFTLTAELVGTQAAAN
jgi:type IV pilus assembly protein PilN